MLIVLPISQRDMPLALPLARWIKKLSPYPRHDILLAYSQELQLSDREAVAAVIRDCGWRGPARAFECAVPVQQWPAAPNAIFRQVADMVANSPDFQRPWYFMEPDCTPMHRRWADALADAYNADLSHPFMGVIDPTYFTTEHGQLIQAGEHLCGTAIYPANLRAYTGAHLHCANAFDLAMARDIRPHARACPLMQDNWSTGEYRREGGRIVCSAVTLRVALSGRSLVREVRDGVAVVHGCKDGSLLRLLQAEIGAAPAAPPPEASSVIPAQPLAPVKTERKKRHGKPFRRSKRKKM